MVRYIDFEEEKLAIPIPDDWVVEIKPMGWQVWAYDPESLAGVSEIADTKEEAIKKVADRMYDWLLR